MAGYISPSSNHQFTAGPNFRLGFRKISKWVICILAVKSFTGGEVFATHTNNPADAVDHGVTGISVKNKGGNNVDKQDKEGMFEKYLSYIATYLPPEMAEQLNNIDQDQVRDFINNLDNVKLQEFIDKIDDTKVQEFIDKIDDDKVQEIINSIDDETVQKLIDSIDNDKVQEFISSIDEHKIEELMSKIDYEKLLDLLGKVDYEKFEDLIDKLDYKKLQGLLSKIDYEKIGDLIGRIDYRKYHGIINKILKKHIGIPVPRFITKHIGQGMFTRLIEKKLKPLKNKVSKQNSSVFDDFKQPNEKSKKSTNILKGGFLNLFGPDDNNDDVFVAKDGKKKVELPAKKALKLPHNIINNAFDKLSNFFIDSSSSSDDDDDSMFFDCEEEPITPTHVIPNGSTANMRGSSGEPLHCAV
ncbi:mucin 2 precursor, putative [Babesia ovis]|uniref:Mucin 2, putative n=1 Tax=Babesia ovis TaxID=5869 RepID=A0A9W5TAE4_BABOV|nr:mucin 2 precursor, putative [Babesia ovis]